MLMLLHTVTSVRIRVNAAGRLSKNMATCCGVKQGCMIAAILFNLYLSDMMNAFNLTNANPVKVNGVIVGWLAYADDLVILDYTPAGLQHMLDSLVSYSAANGLTINIDKSKMMVFSKKQRPKRYLWNLDSKKLEQVMSYKYLGIIVGEKLTWESQWSALKNRCIVSTNALSTFIGRNSGYSATLVINIYLAKIWSMILYGVEIWGHSFVNRMVVFEAKLLRKLLRLPHNLSVEYLYLEFAIKGIWCAYTCQCVLSYEKVVTLANDTIIVPYMQAYLRLEGNMLVGTLGIIQQTYRKWLPGSTPGMSTIAAQKRDIKKKVFELWNEQNITNVASKSNSGPYPEEYLTRITPPKYIVAHPSTSTFRTYLLMKFNMTNALATKGDILGIPKEMRKCRLCGNDVYESLYHLIMNCESLTAIRTKSFKSFNNAIDMTDTTELWMSFMCGNDINLIYYFVIFYVKFVAILKCIK
ncbi:uncharacterized protein [Ambystoma mexicanum]|uniref:uncharacterized protein n=1 Tax=Ambystoma mexicanum TaxID=8296 RepID=UPI0037E8624A